MLHTPANPAATSQPWWCDDCQTGCGPDLACPCCKPPEMLLIDGRGNHLDGCTCKGCTPGRGVVSPWLLRSSTPTPSLSFTPAPSPPDPITVIEGIRAEIAEPLGATSFQLDARFPYNSAPAGTCTTCYQPPLKPGSPYCIYCLTLKNLRDAAPARPAASPRKLEPYGPHWMVVSIYIIIGLYIALITPGVLH